MLALEGLSRTHPGAKGAAVDGVDLELAAGEILVIVGPSGCGKSSVLRLIAGLDAPSRGRVVLEGRDLADVPPEKRDVAMVFQGYALYPHLTARGNIEFPLRMRGVPKGERARKVTAAAEMLGISALLDRWVDQLSGGERQRVAMGRAIVREPKIFLFDEPLSNLDAALRNTLRAELAALLRDLGKAAIYVTHDQVEAMTIGHRVAVMSRGRIEQIGSARAIYEDPETLFVATFVGAPKANAIAIDRSSGARALDVEIDAPERAATLVVRPHDVAIVEGSDAADAICFEATIDVVEPTGAETILHLSRGGEPLRAALRGWAPRAAKERVVVGVPKDRALFFDAAGQRVRPAAGGAA